MEVDTDSELEEFVPSFDPATTAALARAITDSEDESGTPLSTPLLSKEPSVSDHYTDEGDLPALWLIMFSLCPPSCASFAVSMFKTSF